MLSQIQNALSPIEIVMDGRTINYLWYTLHQLQYHQKGSA
jgi:hypothetical protein